MKSAVRIPQWEGRIVSPIVGLVDFIIVPTELSVHIGIQCRSNEHVIQTGIKNLLATFVTTLYVHTRQHAIPTFFGIRTNLLKVPFRLFRFQISQSIGTTDGWKGHLELHLLRIVPKGQYPFHRFAGKAIWSDSRIIVKYGHTLNRLIGLQHKKYLVLRTPSLGKAVSLNRIFIRPFQRSRKSTVAVAFL